MIYLLSAISAFLRRVSGGLFESVPLKKICYELFLSYSPTTIIKILKRWLSAQSPVTRAINFMAGGFTLAGCLRAVNLTLTLSSIVNVN